MLLPPDKKEEEQARDRPRDHHINYQTIPRPDGTTTAGPSNTHSRSTRRAQDVHAIDDDGRADDEGITDDDEAWPTEQSQLLPPPYTEAAAGSKKDRRRRLLLQSLVAVVFATIWFGFLAVMWVRSVNKANKDKDVWTRGGSNGKGGWDHIWSHRTPLLPSETSPHSCDMFNEPILAPTWTNPISTGPAYTANANFTFPLPIKKLFVHARAPNVYGAVEIDASQDSAHRPVDSIHARVEFLTPSVSNLAGWHTCQAGSPGEQGIIIVGPEGSETSNSPWHPRFLKCVVILTMPRGVALSDLKRSGDVWYLGDLEINVPGMSVTFSGDYKAQNLGFADLTVQTARNGIIVGDSLLVQKAYLVTTNAAIVAEHLEAASQPLVLTTQNAPILCNYCHGETLILHTSNAEIGGAYSATRSIDVYTSSSSISGFYRAPEVWMRTTDGNIRSNVEIVEVPSPEKMSLLCATRLAYMDIAVSFVPLNGSNKHVVDHPAKVSITMSTSEASANLNVKNLPAHRAIDLHMDTRNAPVTAHIAKEYQGDFVLQTSTGPRADVRHDDEDENDDRILRLDDKSTTSGVVKGSIARKGVARATPGVEWGTIDIGSWGNSNIVLEL